ncbi:hypothetical protein [Amycolatopsis sp. TNS106]|uniref:hypothetical protein n=1 Tax=Amycolatopsis sp. TNS106 TaxID=2861750 RepID=UPI001C594472|nr:hypothetical protein [Amycolatopsis sp. TNS106]QXV57523.1 hypothetical protein CVV72_11290 [Amycolatopsis sp. TNS106]
MTDSGMPIPRLLVLVRDEESGWTHVAQQPRDPHATPLFTGFLRTTTNGELITAMHKARYHAFATYPIDHDTTAYWFESISPPTSPELPQPVTQSMAATA